MGHLTETENNSAAPPEGWRNGVVLLAFWLCLLFAAGLYATAALSPKLLSWCQLQHEYQTQQWRLLQLEQQTEQLQQVVDALSHDPTFVAELSRWEMAAREPGEEVIPVDLELTLQPETESPFVSRSLASLPADWWPWLYTVSTNEGLRWSMLMTAAGLVIVAFTWFQEPSRSELSAEGTPGPVAVASWRNRYRRTLVDPPLPQ